MQKYLFLQSGFLSVCLLGWILVLVQEQGKMVCSKRDTGSFVPFTYLGLTLDRGVV